MLIHSAHDRLTWMNRPPCCRETAEPPLAPEPVDTMDPVDLPPPLPTVVDLPEARRPDPFMPPRPTSGERAVAQARSYRGRSSASLRGQLPRFQAAGGVTRNCADFVSSVEQNAGRLRGHYNRVDVLETNLPKEGWTPVSAREARPGDIWIANDQSHTEIVSRVGGRGLIGSNNNGQYAQSITEHGHNPASGHYWGRR